MGLQCVRSTFPQCGWSIQTFAFGVSTSTGRAYRCRGARNRAYLSLPRVIYSLPPHTTSRCGNTVNDTLDTRQYTAVALPGFPHGYKVPWLLPQATSPHRHCIETTSFDSDTKEVDLYLYSCHLEVFDACGFGRNLTKTLLPVGKLFDVYSCLKIE